jgi:Mg-chelatase subunit ChlD
LSGGPRLRLGDIVASFSKEGFLMLTTNTWTMILLDVSGSMAGPKLAKAKESVKAYAVDACAMGELVGVMTFSDTARLISAPDNSARGVHERVVGLDIEGGTNLVPALIETEERAGKVSGLRKVVVVTDGMTTRAEEAIAIAERMRRSGWFFVTVGIPDADETFLQRLRGPQGGGSFTQVEGLVKALRDAARLLPPSARI